mgnify:CR=1 FL=1
MTNILITGGLGFIGRTLAEKLIAEGQYNVHIIDVRDCPEELSDKIDYTPLDITNREALAMYFRQHSFDGVVHLAAVSRVEDAERDKEFCIRVNYGGTKNIVDNVSKCENTWMIFGSSREVFGEQEIQPVSELADLCPVNVYGHTKLEGELLTERLKKYVILRFSNVYGNSYDRPERVIPIFLRQALNNQDLTLHGGKQVIDFTYIDDTVDAIMSSIRLCEREDDIREHILVSPGVTNSLLSVAKTIVEVTNSKSNIVIDEKSKRTYDVETFVGDTHHRKEILLDREFISVKDGLLRLLKHRPLT